MTLKEAFSELISSRKEWHKLATTTPEEAQAMAESYKESGTGETEVKKILISAGYFMTENWSSHLGPETRTDAPKHGIVIGDPKEGKV